MPGATRERGGFLGDAETVCIIRKYTARRMMPSGCRRVMVLFEDVTDMVIKESGGLCINNLPSIVSRGLILLTMKSHI